MPHDAACRSRSGRYAAALVVTTIFAAGGCGESFAPRTSPSHLLASAGTGQSARVRDTVPEPLVLRARDGEGRPLAGYPLTWRTSSPTGKIVPLDTVTDTLGYARAKWTLGMEAGSQSAEARMVGFDDVARFVATATSGFRAAALMRGAPLGHMCALDADGAAWCWGTNSSGELGIGTSGGYQRIPLPVTGGLRFRELIGGELTSCGLTHSGELWCWGNSSGQTYVSPFGNGSSEGSPTPVRAGGGLTFSTVDIDYSMTCGVTTGAEGYCWGRGVLGDGTEDRTSLVPVPVSGSHRWRQIGVGDDRACGVTVDAEVMCWTRRSDTHESLAIDQPGPLLVPTPVPGLPPIQSVSVGRYNQCAVATAAAGTCWGIRFNGGATYESPMEYPVGRLPTSRIMTEGSTSVALDSWGGIWMWGETPSCCNHPALSLTPAPLQPRGPWSDVSFSSWGIFGILAEDGTVYGWRPFLPDGLEMLPEAVPAP